MDRFIILYWIGAVILVISSVLYEFGIIDLLPFAVLAILGIDSMITAVIDFKIRDSYKPREFRHIIISEIAFWVGLIIAFFAFLIRIEWLFLGLAIMAMSVFDFVLTQGKGANRKVNMALYKKVKERKIISVSRIYLALWFLSAVLIISSILNNRWVTSLLGLGGMILSFLGYEKTRVKKAVTKKTFLLKEKNYVLYGLMWFASAGLLLLAFVNKIYLVAGVGLVLNILSSLGYKSNRPHLIEHKFPFHKKRSLLTMSIMLVLGFLIIGLGFALYNFNFINIRLLSIIGLAGIITILVPLLSFRMSKKKELVEKRIKLEKKAKKIKWKFLFALEIAYLIGAAFVALGFILFQQQRISLRGLVILAILGLLITVITNLVIYRKKHKKIIEKKTEESSRETEVKSYQLKPIKGISQTQFDELVSFVDKAGVVKVSEAAKKFGISKQLAEEWGKILESHGLLTLHYPTFGELELRKWKK